MNGASCGSRGPKSEKSGVKRARSNWVAISKELLKTDPGAKQRRRERSLEESDVSLLTTRENGVLSVIFLDFLAHWLAENLPETEAKALADMLGSELTLREAGRKWGVDYRRLQECRKALAEAWKEAE